MRLTCVLLLLSACGGSGQDTGEAARRGPLPGVDSTPALVAGTNRSAAGADAGTTRACPPTGLWTSCAIFERLDRSGLAPRRDTGRVTEAGLTVAGERLRVGTATLDLFLYESAEARRRDEARLDRAKYVAYDAPLGMQPLPTLISSANLIALLSSRNDHLRERVSDALTAGPPQPSVAPAGPAAPAAPATPAAPDSFLVAFQTSKGRIVVQAVRAWAPRGTDRFYELVNAKFYDGTKFFRVLGFMAQFGISGDPASNDAWRDRTIPDDHVLQSNTRGFVTYATGGPNTRTTQLFINKRNNARLDAMGFAPFARVIEGMDVVDRLYSGYGEGAPDGPGPSQDRIEHEGNAYLDRYFPLLDSIVTARVVRLKAP